MSTAAESEFAARLEGALQTARRYESGGLQAQARAALPLLTLRARAAASLLRGVLAAPGSEPPPESLHDAFVQELLRFFKSDFFIWVNNPPCCGCGGATSALGVRSPATEEERAGEAGRVEVFTCTAGCGAAHTCFPRFNHPGTLLQTRRGRCGEWANCFTLCCRAAGLRARYVLDWSDHVWTEIWSPGKRRWVHADSCEAAWDTPLLYEQGWGKKLSYVVAFSAECGAVDVSPRYSLNWREALTRRTAVSEPWLATALAHHAVAAHRALPAPRRAAAVARAGLEAAQLAAARNGGAVPAAAELPGRQSGAREWRAARGELGSATGGTAEQPGGAAASRPRRAGPQHTQQRATEALARALAEALSETRKP